MTRSLILGYLLLGGWCAHVRADGGYLQFSEEQGGYRISVFTSPTPLRAGAVDVSVLVQDASTGAAMPHLPATVRLSRAGRRPLEYAATTEAATNKLFRAALFEIPVPGRWELQVRVEGASGPVVIGGEIEAADRMPRWQEMWPWFTWPALVVASFAIRQRARRVR